MEYAFVFLIIFGAALLLTAACLAFSKDPRKSPLMARTSDEALNKDSGRSSMDAHLPAAPAAALPF